MRRINWTEIKLTKYEYTQAYVAIYYSGLNGKIKNIDNIQYRFVSHLKKEALMRHIFMYLKIMKNKTLMKHILLN